MSAARTDDFLSSVMHEGQVDPVPVQNVNGVLDDGEIT
jgi:hypothetical protein